MIRETIRNISRNEYHSGAQLPSIESIAKSYGVARTTVREAIKYMESTGLVYSLHGKGTYLLEFMPSPNGVTFIENVVDYRRMIEVFAITKAAENRTPCELEELKILHENMQNSISAPKRFLEYDRDFHFVISKASRNPFVYSIFNHVSGMFDAVIDALSHVPDYPFEEINADHLHMVDAIESYDAQLAGYRMNNHLDMITAYFDKEWF